MAWTRPVDEGSASRSSGSSRPCLSIASTYRSDRAALANGRALAASICSMWTAVCGPTDPPQWIIRDGHEASQAADSIGLMLWLIALDNFRLIREAA
jgi:hypothetical protein